MIRRFSGRITPMSIESSDITVTPTVIPREDHGLSRKNISKAALKVLYRLNEAGHAAYLVGGSVRDLLLGASPKDFDVATDASPETIHKLFSNSRIIGRRFRLVHVRYGREIIEVATFRGNATEFEDRMHAETGMILRDNVYGNIEDDAVRRDFSINALYYNIADFSIVDFTSGMHDLKRRIIRVIGDPIERYREDPVRMLRAVRFAAKLNFQLAADSAAVIGSMSDMLSHVAPARLFDEVIKITMSGSVNSLFQLLRKYDLFVQLFPATHHLLSAHSSEWGNFLQAALQETDARISAGKSVNPAFLLAVLLWIPLQDRIRYYQEQGLNIFQAMAAAETDVLKEQRKVLAIPRRFTLVMRDMWSLQNHLPQRRRVRIYRTLNHQRFRAAYDFLLLRAQKDPDLQPLADWWTTFQEATSDEQHAMIEQRQRGGKKRDRRDR